MVGACEAAPMTICILTIDLRFNLTKDNGMDWAFMRQNGRCFLPTALLRTNHMTRNEQSFRAHHPSGLFIFISIFAMQCNACQCLSTCRLARTTALTNTSRLSHTSVPLRAHTACTLPLLEYPG